MVVWVLGCSPVQLAHATIGVVSLLGLLLPKFHGDSSVIGGGNAREEVRAVRRGTCWEEAGGAEKKPRKKKSRGRRRGMEGRDAGQEGRRGAGRGMSAEKERSIVISTKLV